MSAVVRAVPSRTWTSRGRAQRALPLPAVQRSARRTPSCDPGGRIVTFATATPGANAITEACVVQHYLHPDLLEEAGIEDFGTWAAPSGEVSPGGSPPMPPPSASSLASPRSPTPPSCSRLGTPPPSTWPPSGPSTATTASPPRPEGHLSAPARSGSSSASPARPRSAGTSTTDRRSGSSSEQHPPRRAASSTRPPATGPRPSCSRRAGPPAWRCWAAPPRRWVPAPTFRLASPSSVAPLAHPLPVPDANQAVHQSTTAVRTHPPSDRPLACRRD